MIYISKGDFVMIFTIAITIILCLVFIGIFYNLYVQLIKKRNKVKEAMSGIDVQLNKRYSLIPNLFKSAAKYMEHERDLLENITSLRSQAASIKSVDEKSVAQKIELDKKITAGMGQFFVSVENYPQLKADGPIIQTMQTYSEIEEHIAAARRFYNSAVNELNNATEIFPSSLVAMFIGVKSYPFFEADEQVKKEINVSDYFNK